MLYNHAALSSMYSLYPLLEPPQAAIILSLPFRLSKNPHSVFHPLPDQQTPQCNDLSRTTPPPLPYSPLCPLPLRQSLLHPFPTSPSPPCHTGRFPRVPCALRTLSIAARQSLLSLRKSRSIGSSVARIGSAKSFYGLWVFWGGFCAGGCV